MQKEKNERKMAIDINRRRNINGVTNNTITKKWKKKSTNLFFFCQNLFRLILFASSSWRLLNELAKFRELSKKSQKTLI